MAYETEDREIQYCFAGIKSCIKGKCYSHEYNITFVFFIAVSMD